MVYIKAVLAAPQAIRPLVLTSFLRSCCVCTSKYWHMLRPVYPDTIKTRIPNNQHLYGILS